MRSLLFTMVIDACGHPGIAGDHLPLSYTAYAPQCVALANPQATNAILPL